MSKKDDIEDLLGEDAKVEPKPAVKKAAAKKAAEPKDKPAAKKAAPKKEAAAEPEERAKKEPISFEEGERDTIANAVVAHFKRSKKAINSRDLAAKLETETRKLRVVLYSLQKKELVTLEPGDSKVTGMTVSPA
jgi:hypothetical protein